MLGYWRKQFFVYHSIIDDLVKSLLNRPPGESRGPDIVPAEAGNHKRKSGFPFSRETLDSGFRRNDEFYGIATFYEFIIIPLFHSSILFCLFNLCDLCDLCG